MVCSGSHLKHTASPLWRRSNFNSYILDGHHLTGHLIGVFIGHLMAPPFKYHLSPEGILSDALMPRAIPPYPSNTTNQLSFLQDNLSSHHPQCTQGYIVWP